MRRSTSTQELKVSSFSGLRNVEATQSFATHIRSKSFLINTTVPLDSGSDLYQSRSLIVFYEYLSHQNETFIIINTAVF